MTTFTYSLRLCAIGAIALLGSYSFACANLITKANAIDIAAKEAYERNYDITWLYVSKNETFWEIFPDFWKFNNHSFTELNDELNKVRASRGYWCVYFLAYSNTTEQDIAIMLDDSTGAVLYIWEEKSREKVKKHAGNHVITLGNAIEIADKKAVEFGDDICGRYYEVTYNTPPWSGYSSKRSTEVKSFIVNSYGTFYDHIEKHNYWDVKYLNIKPVHDGGLQIFVDADNGDVFFKADSFTFLPPPP